MRILGTRSEEVGPGLTKLTILLADAENIENEKTQLHDGLGEGPTPTRSPITS